MSSLSGVGAAQPVSRDLRPEEDLALLQSYELQRVYDLQEQRMIQPVSVRDDGRYGTPRAAPAPMPAIEAAAALSLPVRSAAVKVARGTEAVAPRLAPPLEAGYYTTMIGKPDAPGTAKALPAAWAEEPDLSTAPAPLPYGADVPRIRSLIEELAHGVGQVPLPLQPRQAGDLVAVAPEAATSPSVRRVAAVYKAF